MLTLNPLDALYMKVDAGGTDVNCDVTGMYYDTTAGKVTTGLLGNHNDVPTTAGAMVTPPTSGIVAYVDEIRLFNTAGVTRTVTAYIDRNDAAPDADADTQMDVVALLTGEKAIYANGHWTVYDAAGVPKMSVISPIAATQADMETGTSLTTFVSPGRQHFHPSTVKAWGMAGITGNLLASYNITSVTDTGTGALTVTIATDLSSANYAITAAIGLASTVIAQSCTYDSVAAGSFILRSVVEAGSAADPVTWSWQCCGDLA